MVRLNPHVLGCSVEDFSAIRRAARDPDFISLAIADPYKTPAPHVTQALSQAVTDGVLRYTPLTGYPDLRAAIADKLRRLNGIAADPDTDILVTHGAGHGFLVALMALLQPGDEVLTADPSFPLNFGAVQLLGCTPVSVPLHGPEGIAGFAQRMAAAITPRTRAIILHNPNNPTGDVLPAAILSEIATLACRHDLAVLSDEVYERFVYADPPPPSIATLPGMRERTVTLFGFSKDHVLSGLRVGYLTGPAPIVAAIARVVQNDGVGACSIGQRAAIAALEGPQDHIESWRAEFGRLRHDVTAAVNAIAGLRCVLPEGGYFCFVDARAHGEMMPIWQALIDEARIGVGLGDWYGRHGRGHFRLCYAAVPPERLAVALDRLAKFFATRRLRIAV